MPLIAIRSQIPVKGMNTVLQPREMDQNFAPRIFNFWFYDGIFLRKRPGVVDNDAIAIPGIAPASLRTMFEYSYRSNNAVFVQASDNAVYKYVAGTGYTAQAGVSFTGKVRFAQMKNLLIIGDGTGNAMVYDGAAWRQPATLFGANDVGGPAIGNIFHVHKNRCYAAGNPQFPATLFISDSAASKGLDYWSQQAGGAGELGYIIDCTYDIQRGDVITGLATHRNYLVVFMRNHILVYAITEDPNAGLKSYLVKKITGDGCIATDSIAPFGEEIIFLSANGFKKLTTSLVQADTIVNDISIPINNVIRDITSHPNFDPNTVSATYNPKYGIYVCKLYDPILMKNRVFCYQVNFEAWFEWSGIDANLYTSIDQVTYVLGPSFMKKLDPLAKYDGNAANQIPIQSEIELAPFRSQALENKPRWRKAEFLFETNLASETISVQKIVNLDQNIAFNLQLTALANQKAPSGLNQGLFRIPLSERSELLSFRLTHSAISDFRLKLFEVYINETNIRDMVR